jgi:toxin HigB-1
VIESFASSATEDIYDGVNSKAARGLLPRDLWRIAFRKLDQLDSAILLDDLRAPPGNRLEALRGDRTGQHSIRINEQYRICFIWTESGAERVEIVDYHP